MAEVQIQQDHHLTTKISAKQQFSSVEMYTLGIKDASFKYEEGQVDAGEEFVCWSEFLLTAQTCMKFLYLNLDFWNEIQEKMPNHKYFWIDCIQLALPIFKCTMGNHLLTDSAPPVS